MVGIKFFPAGYGKQHLEMLELPYSAWSPWFAQLTARKITGELPRMQISVPAPWEFYLPLIEARVDIYEAEAAWGYAAPLREPTFRRRREIGDPAGIREMAVAPNGDIYPSVLVMGSPQAVCGNLRRQALADILAGSQTLRRLRALDRASLPGDCRRCALVSVCGGGSRARAWDATGSWSGGDPSCPLVRTVNGQVVAAPENLLPSDVGIASPTYRTIAGARRGQPFRIIHHPAGAEVRVAGRIIHCDARTAEVLEAHLTGSGSLSEGDRDPKTIAALQRAGIDLADLPPATA